MSVPPAVSTVSFSIAMQPPLDLTIIAPMIRARIPIDTRKTNLQGAYSDFVLRLAGSTEVRIDLQAARIIRSSLKRYFYNVVID